MSNFQRVKRDRFFDSLGTTNKNTVPIVSKLPLSDISQLGNIVFNKADNSFYGYDGQNWVNLSSSSAPPTDITNINPNNLPYGSGVEPLGLSYGDLWMDVGDTVGQSPVLRIYYT